MERAEFLTRRDFVRKAAALGAGMLVEGLICQQGAALAQGLAAPRVELPPAIAAGAPPKVAIGGRTQPAGTPAPLARVADESGYDFYAANTTQIEAMRRGQWEGVFYLADEIAQAVARQFDIPADLLHALCFHESAGIPTERSKVLVDEQRQGRTVTRTSYARGAVGLAQLMPFHAQETGGVLDLTDARTNLIRAAQVFNTYREKHDGDRDWVRKTLYDYNAGPNRKTTPPETIQYAENILALWGNPRKMAEWIEKGRADLSLLYWELLPVSPLSVPFGRTGVDFQEPYAGQPSHTGLDLGGEQVVVGTSVRAVAAGLVRYVGRMYDIPGVPFSGRGNTVVLEHRSANPLVKTIRFVTTGYCHLSEFAPGLTVGVSVERGQVIGAVGLTGWTTGPHLHFECALNTPVNTDARKMAREDGWFHPFLMLPPNQKHPGSKSLAA
ncbi:MAG: peptidoglycan DD-metalloendopeptidase family protein [Chloroflexi bacterium]|nr:peptidoglycan DD-metalloendopeptidase family protein [Chloroflexota bacterium]